MEVRYQVLLLKKTVETENYIKEHATIVAGDSNYDNAQTMERALIAGEDPNYPYYVIKNPFIRK